jgi:multidrug efflux pump
MLLSDTAIRRPVFASVLSLLLLVFGLLAFDRLPLREYPDIDPPVVSIQTDYPGAAAAVVETRITQLIEDRIAGLEGIRFIRSTSVDGRSNIDIEFDLSRDIDAAANDVRDRVSRVLDSLPDEADIPDIEKVDSNDNVIMWLNLSSDSMTVPQLTDYAERYLVDRFSVVNGIARVRISGGQSYALRIWVDRIKLAAHDLTMTDIEQALRQENIELPAGYVESVEQQFSVRVERVFTEPNNFRELVLKRSTDGKKIRLADVATVILGTTEHRTSFRGNGETMVGLGITKQSTANTIAVAKGAQKIAALLNPNLPPGMRINQSYNSAVFIEDAIDQVYTTLAIALMLVVLVIFIFLGSARATIVPAITVPIALIATFIVLWTMGFTVNILTLLAMVMAIGLVVDDAIVVLENIHRRMDELGEPPMLAAYRGTREVGFAVIATTAVLISVFAPIIMLEGDIGRLFAEFSLTLSTAVFFSSLVALTLSPVLAALLLKPKQLKAELAQSGENKPSLMLRIDNGFQTLRTFYEQKLAAILHRPILVLATYLTIITLGGLLFMALPQEYAPKEDRGVFFIIVKGPEGASFNYMQKYMDEVERRLLPLVESGEALRVLVRNPGSFGNLANFNTANIVVVLSPWNERRSANEIIKEVKDKLSNLAGIKAAVIMSQGIGGRQSKPVEFVVGGGSFEELGQWRDTLLATIAAENPKLTDLDSDYEVANPQIEVNINYPRAAELGVSVENIGRTLETVLASRRVTTYIENGEEYDVLIEGRREQQNNPSDISNIYVRSETSAKLISMANLASLSEQTSARELNRFNRTRAITIEANLVDGYSLGEALDYLGALVRQQLPDHATIDYKGRSRDFVYAGDSSALIFGLAIIVMFLVLAAQFESFISPLIITLTVPLAIGGGLLGLWLTNQSLNIYSQIALLMLISLAAKNAILIVEFANQLRDQGHSVEDAILAASSLRLRPILMTSITTVAGTLPLILAFGAGAESRAVLGITLFSGVLVATFFTLAMVPMAYLKLAKYSQPPGASANKLATEIATHEDIV